MSFVQPQRPSGAHTPSIYLAIGSGFGLLVGLLGALLFGILAAREIRAGGLTQAMGNMSLAWSAGLVALLNIPALLYSVPRIGGRPVPRWTLAGSWRLASLALILWAAIVAGAGLLATRLTIATVIFLPPLGLLAAGIPVWWLVEFGRRGLRTSPQRFWGAVSITLVVTMPVVILTELLGFLMIGALLLVWLTSSSPDLVTQLLELARSYTRGGAVSPQSLIDALSPYLERPGILLAGLAIFGLIMPLVEELFKTLALWFVPGWRMSQAEGFLLGLVAGGTFALIETLNTLPAMIGPEWAFLILARAATSLLHITCGGLVGWGLASAWTSEKYLRLGGLLLLAILIHGTWNLFVQFSAIQGLSSRLPLNIGSFSRLAPFVLVSVPVLMLLLLTWLNHHLRGRLAIENAHSAAAAAAAQALVLATLPALAGGFADPTYPLDPAVPAAGPLEPHLIESPDIQPPTAPPAQ